MSGHFTVYLKTVTVGSICFALCGLLILGPRSLSSLLSSEKIYELLIITMIVFAISWVVSFITMYLPFLGAVMIAQRLKIKHWIYFVFSAVILSSPLILMFISIPPLGINDLGFEPTFVEKILRVAPIFCLSACAAGWTSWVLLRKDASEAHRVGGKY